MEPSGRSPYDPELAAQLARTEQPGPLFADRLLERREFERSAPVDELVGRRGITHSERLVAGPSGDIPVSIFRRDGADTAVPAPWLLFIHGGGMVSGDRFAGIDETIEWVDSLGIVCITVEYGLAPGNPHPGPAEDCFAALAWAFENARELGLDVSAGFVSGRSAGGGLAVMTALIARDRLAASLRGLILACPMLDDRGATASTTTFDDDVRWSAASNALGWRLLLGDERLAPDLVAIIPARAKDLRNLPPTFIDSGSAEIFRDEVVEFAARLATAGVPAELHVWDGGFHDFDADFPTASLSIDAKRTRRDWFVRQLDPGAARTT